MVAKAGLAYWLPRVGIAALCLGVGYLIASKVMTLAPRADVAPPKQPPRTEAQLAELERLVTISPPKTQQPYVKALKDSHTVAVAIKLSPQVDGFSILGGISVAGIKASVFVYGRDVESLKETLEKMHSAGVVVGSLGYAPADLNRLSREQLDLGFKATNRLIFEAVGERPRFFGWEGSEPNGDVIDYAAINGMVTLKLNPYDPRTSPNRLPPFALLDGERVQGLSLSDVFDNLQTHGYRFVGLDEAFPPAKAGRM